MSDPTVAVPHRHHEVAGASCRAVSEALDAVRTAPGIVAGLRRLDDLVAAASTDDGTSLAQLTSAVGDPADDVTGIAAVHALGGLRSCAGHPLLLSLLRTGPPHLREHAAAALGSGPVHRDAVPLLVAMVADGGFAAMLAQRALERWGAADPDAVGEALAAAVAAEDAAAARARLVETIGLVPGAATRRHLLARAGDGAEDQAVRAAAVAALGDRPAGPDPEVTATLRRIAAGGGALADTATLALHDRAPDDLALHDRGRSTAGRATGDPRRTSSDGLSVVQLFLHADIDATLSHAGRGDNGGIATLLVQLGDALVARGGVSRVVTISRGAPHDAARELSALRAPGHHYASVPIWGPPPHQAQAWSLRVTARRGIRRILRAAGRVDVLHLRMADVGSMAAAEVARELGVPVVLTLAPDPHALIAAREATGSLTRAGFGSADLVEHLVLRDHLVRGIAGEAAHLVLFPRPRLREDLRELLGVDLADPTMRSSVVAEGVDLDAIERARSAVGTATLVGEPVPPHLQDLDAVLGALPVERRHLPLAVSVGRLHRVKGMASLVEAWAADPVLRERCNLLVVGGDLETPNDDERGELERIAAVVPLSVAADRGLLLAGHRPNPVVAVWLAAARIGRPGLAARGGVYVSASLKEEFGIAILEAMAAGLVVVAPAGGGPATYVDDGVTGVLVDTTSPEALADAVVRALALAQDPDAVARADRDRASVRDRFAIGTMAEALARVYGSVADAATAQDRALAREPALHVAAR